MEDNIAISVKNVSKTFKIPHEKISSLRGAAVSVFSKKRGYEEFKALDDVSFEVKKGEFFGIIGRNGSGKSTLLKILAGIYQTDKGSVKIDGRISPFLELGIGFNPELSGRDNVYLNATVLGLTKKEIDKKFDSIVAFSELERFIDQKLKNYSSGMQVRLAFSVSIHANREILLMDEVLAVGDSNFQSKCLSEFAKYKKMGKTVILVTHDISVVQGYCDRGILLRNGKIVKIGKAEDVGNEYLNQNMSDEEKRASNEEKKIKNKNENDFKKNIEIENILFLNEKGNSQITFKDDEKILIRIIYKINKKEIVKKPCFGVAIHSEFDAHLFGAYTKDDNFNTKPIEDDGYIDLFFEDNNFNSGTYYVTGAIYDGDNKLIPIDRKVKFSKFKIISNYSNYGLVKMKHKWTLQ